MICPVWDSTKTTAPAIPPPPPKGSPGKWEETTPVRVEMLSVGKSTWLRLLCGREKVQHLPPWAWGQHVSARTGKASRARGGWCLLEGRF